MVVFSLYNLVFYLLGASADLSESEDNTLTSKTDLSMLSDEGLELSQRQTDTMFQGPSLDEQAEELIIGAILDGRSQWTYATGRKKNEDGKPCVTIILFEKNLPQTSTFFKQIFL